MFAWALLIFVPHSRLTRLLLLRPLLPALFAVIYGAALWIGREAFFSGGGFRSLESVSLLFQNPWALLAGWIHYLAFDLFVGAWIANDSLKSNIPRPLVAGVLVLTFLFGPLGWLVYQSLRRGQATII